MPVMARGGEEDSEVVAEHVVPEAGRRALDQLAGHGLSFIAVPPEAMAAAAAAADRLNAAIADRYGAAVVGTLPALSSTELAAVTAAVAGWVVADQLRPAFEAVVDAVTRPQVPPPAWFAQARRNAEARQAFLDEFGAFTSEQIASLAGSQATNRRATAHRWQAERRIFAVSYQSQVLYPGFQFDADSGRPKPAVAEVLAMLPSAMTGWALALWWATPVDLLDWGRPVDRLDTAAGEVVDAARADATDWVQAAPA